MNDRTILHAARWVDVEAGEVRSPANIVVEGDRIVSVAVPGNPAENITMTQDVHFVMKDGQVYKDAAST
jgi:imidazolonepropionase-like amidohydrolase